MKKVKLFKAVWDLEDLRDSIDKFLFNEGGQQRDLVDIKLDTGIWQGAAYYSAALIYTE